jgi:hypothetical protein
LTRAVDACLPQSSGCRASPRTAHARTHIVLAPTHTRRARAHRARTHRATPQHGHTGAHASISVSRRAEDVCDPKALGCERATSWGRCRFFLPVRRMHTTHTVPHRYTHAHAHTTSHRSHNHTHTCTLAHHTIKKRTKQGLPCERSRDGASGDDRRSVAGQVISRPINGTPSMATRRVPITRLLTSDSREKAARCEPGVVLP